MCKSKAKGGRRCGYHLGAGVGSALTGYAAATTGMTQQQAAAEFEAVRREHAGADAPTREEVDTFLQTTAASVRRSPGLSEHKRQSILGRLRSALGRVRPDSGTFAAWAHLAAGARRKVAAIFLAGAVMAGAGACGSTPDSVDRRPAPAEPTSISAPVETAPTKEAADIEAFSATGEAVEVFGQDRADAGYREAAAFAAETAFDPDLLGNPRPTAADFAEGLTGRLTASAAADYEALVARALRGDKEAEGDLAAQRFSAIGGQGISLPTSGPLVVNETITTPKVGVDRSQGQPRLAVQFTQRAEVRLVQDGAPVRSPATKTVRAWLVPAPEGSGHTWLVDGFHADFRIGDMVSDA